LNAPFGARWRHFSTRGGKFGVTNRQQSFDAVIIGGGVLGCATAHALGARGLRVALVERGEIGQGASNDSFAWINATSKSTDEAYHRLNALGAQRYRELASVWSEQRIGLHSSGMLEWSSPADGVGLQALRARAEQLEAWGYTVGWVTREELVVMEPHVRFEEAAQGLHAMNDAWLDVPTFLRFLIAELRAGGATVLEHCRAVELIANGEGKVLGLETDVGRLHSEQVVVATGAETPDVLSALTGYEAFASRFPMRRAPGLLVTTPACEPRPLVRHILYSSDPAHLHVRETPDGGLLLGADDTDGQVTEDGSQEGIRKAALVLVERTQRLIPSFEGAALLDRCRFGIGVRAVPIDGKSIAGPMLSAEGLHIVLTHSGVTLALALGELVADSIETGTVARQLDPFGLERFQAIA
jgi:glycine/D-amino acid oxidase-like deaminating enzyme